MSSGIVSQYPNCSTQIQEFLVLKTSKKWILMFKGKIVWKTKYDQEIFNYIMRTYPNLRKGWVILKLGELADFERIGRSKKK